MLSGGLLDTIGKPPGWTMPGSFNRLPFVIDQNHEVFVGSLNGEHSQIPVWSNNSNQGQINFVKTGDGWQTQIHMPLDEDKTTPDLYSKVERIRDEWLSTM
jgi:hypothetical protein